MCPWPPTGSSVEFNIVLLSDIDTLETRIKASCIIFVGINSAMQEVMNSSPVLLAQQYYSGLAALCNTSASVALQPVLAQDGCLRRELATMILRASASMHIRFTFRLQTWNFKLVCLPFQTSCEQRTIARAFFSANTCCLQPEFAGRVRAAIDSSFFIIQVVFV
jgi:hypothetical protein